VVLSEALDEKAIDILVDLTFWKIFPQQCDKWKATKKYVCEESEKQFAERSDAACQDLLRKGGNLRRALYESVVDHVTEHFP
jgi:hypothetical protein